MNIRFETQNEMPAGWGVVQRVVMNAPFLKAGPKALYALMASYAGLHSNDDYTAHGECFPSEATLASNLVVTDRTIRNWLTDLELCGLVYVEARPGTSNRYRIRWAKPEQAWYSPRKRASGVKVKGGKSVPPPRKERSTPPRKPVSAEVDPPKGNPAISSAASSWLRSEIGGILNKGQEANISMLDLSNYIVDGLTNEQYTGLCKSVAKRYAGRLRIWTPEAAKDLAV